MASRVILLVLLCGVACNGIPSAELPEVEAGANELPIEAISVVQWAPEDPIVEVATKSPMADITQPPKPVTEAPVEAITAAAELNAIVPIAGDNDAFERVLPIAADGSVSGDDAGSVEGSRFKALGDGEVSEPVMVTGEESASVMPTGGCSSPAFKLTTLGYIFVVLFTLQ